MTLTSPISANDVMAALRRKLGPERMNAIMQRSRKHEDRRGFGLCCWALKNCPCNRPSWPDVARMMCRTKHSSAWTAARNHEARRGERGLDFDMWSVRATAMILRNA